MATQLDAKKASDQGSNILLLGKGGVGKSWTIENYIETPNTVKTAPTGIAALNINAETNHSVFGLPLGIPLKSDMNKISPKMKELFVDDTVDKLVMDEAGMIRADAFDLIDRKLRIVRGVDKPFGGIQLVATGDFFQFPPIIGYKEWSRYYGSYRTPYIFSSNVWEEASMQVINLTEAYRNKNQEQLDVLEAIRTKSIRCKRAVEALNDLCVSNEKGIIQLANYNKDADAINNDNYHKLKSKEVTFLADKTGSFKKEDSLVPTTVRLKLGMKVMIAANSTPAHSFEYKNGQRGELVGIKDDYVSVLIDGDDFPVEVIRSKWTTTEVHKIAGKLSRTEVGSFSQIPILAGWATSTHKAQGMSLGKFSYDKGDKAFSAGQIYVAASRATDLANVNLIRPIEYSDIIVDKNVKAWYRKMGIK